MTSREWYLENGKDFDSRPEIIQACSDALDISKRNARKAIKRLEDNEGFTLGEDSNKSKIENKVDEKGIGHLSFISKVPVNVDELIALAGLDEAIYEVDRGRVGFWGNEKNANFQHRCQYVRKVSEGCELFLEQVKESMEDFIPTYPKLNYNRKTEEGYLLEQSLYDLHLGLVSNTYNVDIGIQRYYEASQRIADWYKDKPISQIVMVVGQDFFNANDRFGQTVKLNYRDDSPLWKDTFRRGFETVVKSIDLAQTIAPVHIVVVSGNHDSDRTYHMGFALEMWYRNCPQVTVDNSDANFKFYRWKNVLLGYTHGDACKITELPMIMATRSNPEDWVASKFRMWNIGHTHSGKEKHIFSRPTTIKDDIHGIRIQTSPALCSHSTWEAWKGYDSIRSALGTLWHGTEGDINSFRFNVN